MNVSAAIGGSEVRTQCGIPSSRHDHAKGARPHKRGGNAPGRGRHGIQAGGLAARSVNILFHVCLPPVTGSALERASPTPTGAPAPLWNPPEGGTPPLGTPRRAVTPPRDSARLPRVATARFRDEPS